MALETRVYSVLVVSSVEKFNTSLSSLLPETSYAPVHTAESIATARRMLLERAYDMVLVNTPLPDELGVRFAIDVCSDRSTVALLFVKNEMYGDTYAKVVRHGVFTLPKPTSPSAVGEAVSFMCAARERLRTLEKKTLSIEEKMEEIRRVNRAKWLLIEVLKMTEEEAHRFIEKQAMDACVSKKEIADNIIKTFT